ncbi:MAG: hypothetical protein ACFFEF_02905 [Candidatus Thorarchaeota archaeon]
MSKTSLNQTVTEIWKDPNIGIIVIGAMVWILGFYNIPILQPFLLTIGFGLTATATAISALQRSISSAKLGLIIGGILYLVGNFILGIPIINLIAPFIIVPGAVLILFYAIPLAIQSGKVPFVEEIKASLEHKGKKEKVVDTETDDKDSEDTRKDE